MESVVFQKTVIESTFNNYYRIEAKYEYWIVHFMIWIIESTNKIIIPLMNSFVH